MSQHQGVDGGSGERQGGTSSGSGGSGAGGSGAGLTGRTAPAHSGSDPVMHSSSTPGTETWISSLMLSPRETEKLVIYQVAELARRRRDRGVKLNFPESIALVCEALLEAARDGRSLAETMEIGKQVLTRDQVLPEVPSMVTLVQVEATFATGTQLVSVADPIA